MKVQRLGIETKIMYSETLTGYTLTNCPEDSLFRI